MNRLTGRDELGYYAPRDITLNCLKHRGDVIDRLAKYEDLMEQGRLVVLPCKVGDTVYFRTFAKNATVDLGIQPHEVIAIRTYAVVKGEFCNVELPIDRFGTSVFLSREEAEAALKAKEV